jgi:2-haloacid dehalogenase
MDKIILFDAYGTLFKVDTENEQLDSLLGDDKARFLDLWRRKLLEYCWLTSLMEDFEGFNSIIDKALSYSCDVFKIKFKAIQPILLNIYTNPTLFDDAKKIIPNLNAICCIISNGEPDTLRKAVISNNLEKHINRIFSASQVQKFKVSPLVYRMATAHYNIGPSKMYFVSSNSWDISGANHFGYQTVWVNRTGQVFDKLVEGPDFEIQSLMELPQILTLE